MRISSFAYLTEQCQILPYIFKLHKLYLIICLPKLRKICIYSDLCKIAKNSSLKNSFRNSSITHLKPGSYLFCSISFFGGITSFWGYCILYYFLYTQVSLFIYIILLYIYPKNNILNIFKHITWILRFYGFITWILRFYGFIA